VVSYDFPANTYHRHNEITVRHGMQKYPNSQISWVWKMVCARLFFLCLHARTGNEATSNHIWSGPCSDTMLFLCPDLQYPGHLIVHSKLCCCQSGTTFTYLCECELIRPTNEVCLCGVKSNYYYNCEWTALKCKTLGAIPVHAVHKGWGVHDTRHEETDNWWVGLHTAAPPWGRAFNYC